MVQSPEEVKAAERRVLVARLIRHIIERLGGQSRTMRYVKVTYC